MTDSELAVQWAEEFTVPADWVLRGIMACREVEADPEYFYDRYPRKTDVPMRHDVDDAFRNLFVRDVYKRWPHVKR